MIQNSNIIKLKYKNKIYAYILKKEIFKNQYNFITNNTDPLQLGFFQMKDGDKSILHYHKNNKRISFKTSEYLYVISGSIEISFYSLHNNLLSNHKVKKGGSVLIFDLAHEIKYKNSTKLLEIKTGPFIQNDKSQIKI
tara:strand:- start:383 stop:796 length:414 start_codon:yes stop_codon:yes gene_type:complete